MDVNDVKIRKAIGKKIRKARRDLDLSQAALGQKMDVSDKTIASWEAGRNEIGAVSLNRLARILGQPITYFYDVPNDAAQQSLDKAA